MRLVVQTTAALSSSWPAVRSAVASAQIRSPVAVRLASARTPRRAMTRSRCRPGRTSPSDEITSRIRSKTSGTASTIQVHQGAPGNSQPWDRLTTPLTTSRANAVSMATAACTRASRTASLTPSVVRGPWSLTRAASPGCPQGASSRRDEQRPATPKAADAGGQAGSARDREELRELVVPASGSRPPAQLRLDLGDVLGDLGLGLVADHVAGDDAHALHVRLDRRVAHAGLHPDVHRLEAGADEVVLHLRDAPQVAVERADPAVVDGLDVGDDVPVGLLAAAAGHEDGDDAARLQGPGHRRRRLPLAREPVVGHRADRRGRRRPRGPASSRRPPARA